MQKRGEVDVEDVSTNEQLADPLTKSLTKDKFRSLFEQYGLQDL